MSPVLLVCIWAGIILVPYLLASVNFAIIVSWCWKREDIRKYGSGNAGMTNILRTYGKLPALITLLGDFGKTVLGVLISRWLFALLGVPDFDGAYIGGLFALLGHIYPIFFKFRGGKGVLTGCGILAVVQPIACVISVAIFLICVLLTKYVSLGSILGTSAFPICVIVINLLNARPILWEFLFALVFTILIVGKHASNIKRLVTGTERKVSLRKKPAQEA